MPGEKTKANETVGEINLSAADREVLSYSQKEEAEADRIFKEMNGGTPDDKKADDDLKKDKAKAEKKVDEEEKGEQEPEKKPDETKPVKKLTPEEEQAELDKIPNDQLKNNLTVENAEKRISAAQKRMHATNELAAKMQKENEELRRMLDEKIVEYETLPAKKTETRALEEKEPETQKIKDEEIEKSLESLRQEYPEIAEPMIKMMARQQAENDNLKKQITDINTWKEGREKTAEDTSKQAHFKSIADVHPDYLDISKEPLFDDWIDGLPSIEKAGASWIRQNGSTQDVIELLTKYKKANGYELSDPSSELRKETEEKVDSKLEKAKKLTTPSFRKSKDVNLLDNQVKFTSEEIRKMSSKEFLEREAEIDAALAEGAII